MASVSDGTATKNPTANSARRSSKNFRAFKTPPDSTLLRFVPEDPELVGGMLAQLGFSFRGQHRRKPVQLWTSGDARIIIDPHAAELKQWCSVLAFRY